MRWGIILIQALMLILLALEYQSQREQNRQLKILYDQAIQYSQQHIPRKTANERLLWKTKG
jgi:hypothetical protein